MAESQSAASHPSDQEEGQKRILVLMNQNKEVEVYFDFVKKQNFDVKISYQLQEVLNELPKFKPDIVLISWNLKNIDIKKVCKFLELRTNTLCIVFGEEYSAKTSSGITSGGFSNTLLPPLSGRAIALRLNSLIKEQAQKKLKEEKLKKRAEENKFKMAWNDAFDEDTTEEKSPSKIVVPGPETPLPDLKWDLEEDSADAEEKIWKSETEEKSENGTDSRKKYYYFKGPSPQNYKTQIQKGQKQGKVPLIMTERPATSSEIKIFKKAQNAKEFGLMQEGIATNDLSIKQEALNAEDFSLKQEAPKAEDFGLTQEASKGQSFNLKQEGAKELKSGTEYKSLIEKCMVTALTSINAAPSSKKSSTQTLYTSFLVKTQGLVGYVVIAESSGIPDFDFSAKLKTALIEALNAQGEAPSTEEEILEVMTPPMDFEQWARYKSEFYMARAIDMMNYEIAFVKIDGLPAMKDAENNLCCISIKDFAQDKNLLFDIYILLPKNNRFILYLKKGSELTKSTLGRLESFGGHFLYIQKSDRSLFLTYIIKNLLLTS